MSLNDQGLTVDDIFSAVFSSAKHLTEHNLPGSINDLHHRLKNSVRLSISQR